MTVHKMSNVEINMESAKGAAQTIEGITKANPGVVSITGHTNQNGDYLQLAVQGMSQLNGRVFRVCNVAVDTFQLEETVGGGGIDTSEFSDFSSGTAEKITFGTSITTAANISASGGDFEFLDASVVHTNQKAQIPGSANPLVRGIDHLWDVADEGQIAMKKASDRQQQRAFKLRFGVGGPIEVFSGYVGFTGSPTGNAHEIIKTPATITAFGAPSYYSS